VDIVKRVLDQVRKSNGSILALIFFLKFGEAIMITTRNGCPKYTDSKFADTLMFVTALLERPPASPLNNRRMDRWFVICRLSWIFL
jgi:hypothetical protein